MASRKKRHSNHIFNDFQNNKLDVILINACGAIGASAHAIATNEVPDSQVRQRKMLIVQNDLDVNIDLQKRGRINRTGQRADLPPLYEYVITSIPSEKRLNMMLRAKLRSLSANTTASQDQDKAQADFLDIGNKYGDLVAKEFLEAHPDLITTLGVTGKASASALLARTAMLSVAAQQEIIDELFSSYTALEEELRRINQWDLEREFRDFEAKLVSEELFTTPLDDTRLGGGSYLGTYKCKHKTHPFKYDDLMEAAASAKAAFKKQFRTKTALLEEIQDYYTAERKKIREKNGKREKLLTLGISVLLTKHLAHPEVLPTILSKAQKATYTIYMDIPYLLNKGGCTNQDFVIRKVSAYSYDCAKNRAREERELVKIDDQEKRLLQIISKMKIGNFYTNFPSILNNDECPKRVYGMLKEIKFGKNPENRFMPSKVEFVFALSAVYKEIKINLVHNSKWSNYEKLTTLSQSACRLDSDTWDTEIARNNNRVLERKIITGNILGAYAHPAIMKLTPKFIKFTRQEGKKCVTDNGLLLPIDTSKIEKELTSITLPISEGFKFANNPHISYPITGIGTTFTLQVFQDASNDLQYEVTVHESEAKTFEGEQKFNGLRNHFAALPVKPLFNDGRKKQTNKKPLVYYTTGKRKFGEERLMEVISQLSSLNAVILIPREMLTIGEISKLSQISHSREEAWDVLDWKGKDAIVVPPTRERVLAHISAPVTQEKGEEVECLSPNVALAQKTLELHGKEMTDETRSKLREYFFRWKLNNLTPYDQFIAQKIRITLQTELTNRSNGATIDFGKSLHAIQEKADSQHLSPVGKAIVRFEQEFQLLSPSVDKVQEFLDSCPCSPRLEKIRTALQEYIDGKEEIIC